MSASVANTAALLALAGSVGAVCTHVQSDTGALSLYLLGTLQGTLLIALVVRAFGAGKSPAVAAPAKAKAAKGEAAAEDAECASTPRTLLKSVSAVQSMALVPASAAQPSRGAVIAEVEYSLEEYEAMRQRKRDGEADAPPPPPPPPPASGRGNKSPSKEKPAATPAKPSDSSTRRRRQSLRTPKSVDRLVEQ